MTTEIELLREVMRREFQDLLEYERARILALETTCAALVLEIAEVRVMATPPAPAEIEAVADEIEAAASGVESVDAEGDEASTEDALEADGVPADVAEEAAERARLSDESEQESFSD